ncbi:MAG: phosphotransacetylase family protein [Anaerolineales bacterium]|nr:phosphotransacetylase family protein [Anaerolineales bacterium]
MKSIYVTSIERFSGKTATCLALGRRFQEAGYRVGFLKPISLQPWHIGRHLADEDAAFAKEVLHLAAEPWEISPVVVTPELLKDYLAGKEPLDLEARIKSACDRVGVDRDVLIAEGGASLREGYFLGLPSSSFAEKFGCQILVVVRYQDQIRLLDDVLAAREHVGEALRGILINRVPEDALAFIQHSTQPYLEKAGVPVFGVLPEDRHLSALTVKELVEALNPQVLTSKINEEALVETLTVGAMTAEAALSRFRKGVNKGVITGGDRTDIQLAALETSTTCLILTGNLHPSPLIIKQADEFDVTILLVKANTMETIESIERIFGKTRLGQPVKLQRFMELVNAHLDFERLRQAFGIQPRK